MLVIRIKEVHAEVGWMLLGWRDVEEEEGRFSKALQRSLEQRVSSRLLWLRLCAESLCRTLAYDRLAGLRDAN